MILRQRAFQLSVAASLLLIPVAFAQPPATGARQPLVYLLVSETILREKPSPDAPQAARLKAFEIVLAEERVPGWLLVQGSSSTSLSTTRELWTPVVRDNILPDSFERIQRRKAKLELEDWPMAVKIDVLRGRIRRGFTAHQVRLALGDPREKLLQKRGRDVYETWRYDDQLVTFSHTGVDSIQPITARASGLAGGSSEAPRSEVGSAPAARQ